MKRDVNKWMVANHPAMSWAESIKWVNAWIGKPGDSSRKSEGWHWKEDKKKKEKKRKKRKKEKKKKVERITLEIYSVIPLINRKGRK